MRFVGPEHGLMYPEVSPSGDHRNLLDTGWDIAWPGPGRLYLAEADIADILCGEDVLAAAAVVEALTARGWVSPDEFKAAVADANDAIAGRDETIAELKVEADGLRASVARGFVTPVGYSTATVVTGGEIAVAGVVGGGNGNSDGRGAA